MRTGRANADEDAGLAVPNGLCKCPASSENHKQGK